MANPTATVAEVPVANPSKPSVKLAPFYTAAMMKMMIGSQ